VEKKQTYEQLEQKVEELEKEAAKLKTMEDVLSEKNLQLKILQQVTASVHSTLELKKVFRQITDGVVHSLGYTSSLIAMLN
jgi:hypothetical protein